MRKLDGSNDKRTFRMSIFASFLRGAYKLSGAKKAFALPEDLLEVIRLITITMAGMKAE